MEKYIIALASYTCMLFGNWYVMQPHCFAATTTIAAEMKMMTMTTKDDANDGEDMEDECVLLCFSLSFLSSLLTYFAASKQSSFSVRLLLLNEHPAVVVVE